MMKLVLLALACLISLQTAQAQSAYIATPLIGFQQGIYLQIVPAASTSQQCLVYGVPTPYGYAPQASTPLFAYTPQNSGTHILQFAYDSSNLLLSPFLAPGNTSLTIDTTNQTNPLISFNSTASPYGASGAITVFLSNKTTNAVLCYSQIQFTVDSNLSCAPTYGGIYSSSGSTPSPPSAPSSAGTFVVPSSTVYAPTYVSTTVINQFISVTNIQITNVVTNVNNVQKTTIINNIVATPPAPAPVNCTLTPTNAACAKTPTAVIVAPSPGKATPPVAPSSGPTVTPTIIAPPKTSPAVAPPTQLPTSPPPQPASPPPVVLPQQASSPSFGAPASGK